MARTTLLAIALTLALLAGCKGFYLAGDGGAHASNFNASPPPAHRTTDGTSR